MTNQTLPTLYVYFINSFLYLKGQIFGGYINVTKIEYKPVDNFYVPVLPTPMSLCLYQ